MKIKEGDKIPSIDFFYLDESGPKKIKSTELLNNHKAIIIGVPGAFTKVCSAKHLPGYINNFEQAQKKGITKIICVSVNDPNVMNAWGINQNVGNKIFMAEFVLGTPYWSVIFLRLHLPDLWNVVCGLRYRHKISFSYFMSCIY